MSLLSNFVLLRTFWTLLDIGFTDEFVAESLSFLANFAFFFRHFGTSFLDFQVLIEAGSGKATTEKPEHPDSRRPFRPQ